MRCQSVYISAAYELWSGRLLLSTSSEYLPEQPLLSYSSIRNRRYKSRPSEFSRRHIIYRTDGLDEAFRLLNSPRERRAWANAWKLALITCRSQQHTEAELDGWRAQQNENIYTTIVLFLYLFLKFRPFLLQSRFKCTLITITPL